MYKFVIAWACALACMPLQAQGLDREQLGDIQERPDTLETVEQAHMRGLDETAEKNRRLGIELVDYWKDQPDNGDPVRHFPTQFEVPPQYAGSVTKEERKLMGRRLHAITDYVLSLTPLRDPDINVTLMPSLYRLKMNDGHYLVMSLGYGVDFKGTKSAFGISTSIDEGRPSRLVGHTAGGCQRKQLTFSWDAGKEALEFGTQRPQPGTAITWIQIAGPAPRTLYLEDGDIESEEGLKAKGRVAALILSLDCAKLLSLANLP
jgi:hypothetical protein